MIASVKPLSELLAPELVEPLEAMLRTLGHGDDARIEAKRGGANNRTYRLNCGSTPLFLKWYFRDKEDGRDRLGAEFAFAKAAWAHNIHTVPQPLIKDDAAGLAIYEFVYGRRLDRTEINVTHIEQALTFVRRLATMRFAPDAMALGDASEACFTMNEHVALVNRRVQNLVEMQAETAADEEALVFVSNELVPAWHSQIARLGRRAAKAGVPLDEPLAARDRCLSPSDFGFHNAVLEGGGRLRFVDFEYAGWDDPAKLVCDFFCQPAVPVPRQFLDAVATTVVEPLPNRSMHRHRIDLLWPVYRIKWCCIMLNVFGDAGGRRRAFAQPAEHLENAKKTQLALARQTLRSLMESSEE